MSDVVQYQTHGAVGLIAINRPEARNAINTSVLLGMRRALKKAAGDETLRALVLTGRGGAFSAGADVAEWADKLKGIDPHPDTDWVEEAIKMVQDVFTFPKPTIAMIDGAAVGAGLDMALACDFRIASDRSKFICAYTRVGYPPDAGGSWLMPRLMGIEAAKRFAYSGDLWTAEQAKAEGMLTEVVPADALHEAAFAMAEKYAAGPTVAIGLAKALIDTAQSRTLAEQQIEEQRAGKICGATDDHAEGLAAANERRAPVFKGR